MRRIDSYAHLEDLGRVRLSKSFFMRDFLHSEIAQWHGLRNMPDFPDRAIEVGTKLCEHLLEPLQQTFGRIHLRSGYRSPEVNSLGNANRLNCASNEANHSAHIWDYPDGQGRRGATACVVVPWLVDRIAHGGHWTEMAWWIHDHLPYNTLYFFPKLAAFNINWHEVPQRRIDSYAEPRGCLTKPGMANHGGSHALMYSGFPKLVGERPDGGLRLAAPVQTDEPPPAHAAAELGSAVQHRAVAAAETGTRRAAPAKTARPADDVVAAGVVHYRAIHTKSRWRKVKSHRSIDAAIRGRDGAAALFQRKVRIDYQKHGDPICVVAWVDGERCGYAVRPEADGSPGLQIVRVDVDQLLGFDARDGASAQEIAALFR